MSLSSIRRCRGMLNMYLPNLSLVVLSLALCMVPLNADLNEDVRKGLLNFSLKIGKELYLNAGAEENVVISPITIATTLSALYLGADGTTRNELAILMGFPKDQTEPAFKELGEIVNRLHLYILSSPPFMPPPKAGEPPRPRLRNIHFHMNPGNVAFIDKNVKLNSDFEKLLILIDRITNLDFANQTSATDAIRQDVIGDGHTVPRGTIPELSSLISTSTRAFLVNYMDGALQWEKAFPASGTRAEKFNIGSKQVDVQMMHAKGTVQVYKSSTSKYTAIGIAHVANVYYTTYILLPDPGQSAKTLLQQLTDKDFVEITNSTLNVEVDYKLPRTKLKWSQSLKEVLKASLPSVFLKPNLSKMTNPEALEALLNHASEYDLYEDGSSLVATTTAGLYEKIPSTVPAPVTSANAVDTNQPFLLYVVSRQNAVPLILLSAVVQNPSN